MGKEIKQVWIPYWQWEDWLNGMWHTLPQRDEPVMLQRAILFTGNYKIYGAAMRAVIKQWPNTMLNSLTNPSINKRAFLGHCACSFAINCPEYITRQAWHLLSEQQRVKADNEAQQTIDLWLKKLKAI
jgi:hypothetical protein